MNIIESTSIVMGHCKVSICCTWLINLLIPPCMQMILLSIRKVRGNQLNSYWFIAMPICHHVPPVNQILNICTHNKSDHLCYKDMLIPRMVNITCK
jgi:hypothetical protein